LWETNCDKSVYVTVTVTPGENEIKECDKPDDKGRSLLDMQEHDDCISLVREWVKCREKPTFKEISLFSQWELLVIENDLLCRRWTAPGTRSEVLQVVVPLEERRMILEVCHDNRTGAHLGLHKTLGKVRQYYYWPGIQNDVRIYIAGCDACTRRKDPLLKEKGTYVDSEYGYAYGKNSC